MLVMKHIWKCQQSWLLISTMILSIISQLSLSELCRTENITATDARGINEKQYIQHALSC